MSAFVPSPAVRRSLVSKAAGRARRGAVGLLPVLLFAFSVQLASAQTYTLEWGSFDGGGGSSAAGAYTLSGALVEIDARVASGGGYTLVGGIDRDVPDVQPPDIPSLFIESADGNVTIRWSSPGLGFVVQQGDGLPASAWTDAPSGSANPATFPMSGPQRFFRLRKF
ncbi:MAG: hypothetical protein AAB466_15080 [Verrucomicrobiota bacterium]